MDCKVVVEKYRRNGVESFEMVPICTSDKFLVSTCEKESTAKVLACRLCMHTHSVRTGLTLIIIELKVAHKCSADK